MMNRKTLFASIGLLFIGVIIGIVFVSGLHWSSEASAQQANSVPQLGNGTYKPTESMQLLKSFNQAFIDVAKVVRPTVVSISVKSEMASKSMPKDQFHNFDGQENEEGEEKEPQSPDLFRFFFPPRGERNMPKMSSGSGVIISSDGYIITNNHVVQDAEKNGEIKVMLDDKREFPAKLIGRDPLTDIAVIKIESKDLPVISFGDSETVQVGEWVVAVGNPLQLNSTVTAGIVSAIGRNLQLMRDAYSVENFIQTDAAINPGNSGGALVNLEGKLIGINTAIASQTGFNAGYGFAVPINLARSVVEDLIRYGKISRGYLGVQISSIDAVTAKAVGLDLPEGAMIQSVLEDGAAKRAGLESGDVILSVDGKKVKEPNDLQAFVARKHPDETVVVKVWRDKKEREFKVKLQARKEETTIASTSPSAPLRHEQLGIEVRELTSEEKKQYDADYGVMVKSVKPFGLAAMRGLQNADVILEVGKKRIKNVSDFKDAMNELKNEAATLIRVRKPDKTTRFIAIEVASK
ncbi:MAG: Do family serine endopeptidase [Chloroherpetonaceae bacterium]|nr:Do family serine endopeptidase [Chloroherpetonaceae bacterium]